MKAATCQATRPSRPAAAIGIPTSPSRPAISSNGFLKWGRYCNIEMDQALATGAALTDPAQRIPHYRRAAALMAQDHPNMVLYHFTWLWGLGDRVSGVNPLPDGILRPAGVVVKGY